MPTSAGATGHFVTAERAECAHQRAALVVGGTRTNECRAFAFEYTGAREGVPGRICRPRGSSSERNVIVCGHDHEHPIIRADAGAIPSGAQCSRTRRSATVAAENHSARA